MALLRWIAGFILAILIVAFAVSNLQPADINWSPFYPAAHLPLYNIALSFMLAGFLIGGAIVWLNTIPLHFSARRQRREIRRLEKELEAAHVVEDDEPLFTGRAAKRLPFFRKKTSLPE